MEEEKKLLATFDDDFALLIEAGFVAVKQMDEAGASQLFHAAHTIRPEHPVPSIGMGYIALNKLELQRATDIFTAVLEQEPEHNLAQALLGICYLLKKKKRKEGEEIIKQLSKESDDPTIVNLCKLSLEWSEKDLRGAKAPFFQSSD